MYCKCRLMLVFRKLCGCINSSKVYCKLGGYRFDEGIGNCINSSKVYCKWQTIRSTSSRSGVLIVAKCIVNCTKIQRLI